MGGRRPVAWLAVIVQPTMTKLRFFGRWRHVAATHCGRACGGGGGTAPLAKRWRQGRQSKKQNRQCRDSDSGRQIQSLE